MAEVKPSTSRGENPVEIMGEASCSGTDGSTYLESVPPSIAAESPSFLTWMWIQILTACSGVWGARGGGLLGPRVLGLASGAQETHEVSESEISSRIAASKSTWSEVPGCDIHHSVPISRPSQLSELKESAPDFFCDDWVEDLKLGRLIGEGAQAQIFEAKVNIRFGWRGDMVLKVFKLDAGFSLADLKRHWPRSMRKDGEDCSESRSIQETSSRFVFEDFHSIGHGERCIIVGATLLKDGRFAFLMWRYQGDLRTLIDVKIEDKIHPWEFDLFFNRREQPPFLVRESLWIMIQIASGMQGLHAEGVLHRDLKAANVLTRDGEVGSMHCDVADYECAMFVEGTRFWRAPEVLQELLLQKLQKSEDRNGEIWTKKMDVYSFGMTCYEILTGQIPFDGYTMSKWGDVIRGERPFLPDYVFPKLRELVEACWHAKPSQRPSFEVILRKLSSLWEEHTIWN